MQIDVADLDPEVLGELNKDLRNQAADRFDEIDKCSLPRSVPVQRQLEFGQRRAA